MASRGPGADVARILICDDSRTFAFGLKHFLEHDPDLRVVGIAANAEQALEALPRVRPDLVTMDLELPGIDGIEATRRILAEHPVPILVVSSHTPRGSERTAAALAAGALDALAKSFVRVDAPTTAAAAALRRRVKRLARTGVARAAAAPSSAQRSSPPPIPDPARKGRRASVVAIGASTGGPQTLLQVLSMLPAAYRLPVLIVQHMSAGFTVGLARWLDQQVPLKVSMAQDGLPLSRGVWFAPEDAHLVLEPSMRMGLDRNTDAGVHRPAADVLLHAVARAAGPGAVGVVLTGMGRDGADGIAAIRAAGGLTVAQDEASSVVWGMPRAAAERGAELVLPPGTIGMTLGALQRREPDR